MHTQTHRLLMRSELEHLLAALWLDSSKGTTTWQQAICQLQLGRKDSIPIRLYGSTPGNENGHKIHDLTLIVEQKAAEPDDGDNYYVELEAPLEATVTFIAAFWGAVGEHGHLLAVSKSGEEVMVGNPWLILKELMAVLVSRQLLEDD